jgi:hypothetical protein
VASAGDVNGDGHADLIVGAPDDDNAGNSSGSARVFSGLDGSVLYSFDGVSADDWYGLSLSGAGDVDRDGYADFLVGAPRQDEFGTDNSGSIRLYSGATGAVLDVFWGAQHEDYFAIARGAGDVNRDGFPDFAFGCLACESVRIVSGLRCLTAFPTFCDASDGSLVACPCANPGDPDTGCDIQQGTGGVGLCVIDQKTSPQNRVTLSGSGYPPNATPASVVIRAGALDSASPVPFGDGIRCVGNPLVRIAGTLATGGVSTHAFGHSAMAGAGVFHYQLWFRNQPPNYCTVEAFNLSNGRSLEW